MAFSTINKSSSFMNTKLYTGNDTTNAITGVGFQPDFTWLKRRNGTYNHYLFDAVRGVTKEINSNNDEAEATFANTLTAWGADGFTLGSEGQTNSNNDTFVSWNWKANGAGSANTDGSTASTVSANTTSKFSIVKYIGTGSSATVGHGLGVAPDMIIIKNLDTNNDWWWVSHKGMAAVDTVMHINTTTAASTAAYGITARSTDTFTVISDGGTNSTGENYIAYCFADVKGYSQFSKYIGNGNADGTFVYTGFKPSFVLIKQTDGTPNWTINDTGRDPTNVNNLRLFPNQNVAESSGSDSMDMLSNGFKLRSTDSGNNGSGNTYIYMAFGQPIISNGGVCATAR